MTADLLLGSKDRGYAYGLTAVIFNCIQRLLYRSAGRHRNGKNQYVLTLDHGDDVITEQHLTAAHLRSYHVDGLMGVDVTEIILHQRISETGSHDLGTVQTENGIHNGGRITVAAAKLFSHSLRLGKTGLLRRYVNIIVAVRTVGSKMPLCHSQKQMVLLGFDLQNLIRRHKISS